MAAQRFLRKALTRHGRPERIVIDGSQTNYEAILSCDAESRLRQRSRRPLKPIRIRNSRHLNNRIEQDHRRIKRRIRSMLGFKSHANDVVILSGIEMIHMMGKRQERYAYKSVDRCFDIRLPDGQAEMAVHNPISRFATEPFVGVAGFEGPVRAERIRSPPATLLRPLAEYEAVAGGSW